MPSKEEMEGWAQISQHPWGNDTDVIHAVKTIGEVALQMQGDKQSNLSTLILGAKWKLLSEVRSRQRGGISFIKEDERMYENLPEALNTYVEQDLVRQMHEYDKTTSRATNIEKVTEKAITIAKRMEQVSAGSEVAATLLRMAELLRSSEFTRAELQAMNNTFFKIMQELEKSEPELLKRLFTKAAEDAK